jgi:hypothetical protein
VVVSGGFVAVLVLGGIALLRAKFGDESYEKFVIRLFKYLIIATVVGFACLYVYSHFLS